jgi:hypothetical protein
MNQVTQNIEDYIRREVELQHDPSGFTGMVLAWQYAMELYSTGKLIPSEHDAMVLAYYVKDHEQANVLDYSNNYRHIQVQRKDDPTKNIGADWRHIPRQMELLFEDMYGDTLDPRGGENKPLSEDQVDYYTRRLLEIHPWIDGNGRTASILRNWLLSTLEEPTDLPFYFGEGN